MSEWQKILTEIKNYKKKHYEEEGVTLWFRGQTDANWKLESTLHRYIKNAFNRIGQPFEEANAIEYLYKQYKTLYRKYHSKAWHLLSESEKKDWGVIFSMRHHSIDTTLLDWTESFVYALFFANLNRNPSDDAAIFTLHPPKLNRASVDFEHLIALDHQFHSYVTQINTNRYHPYFKKNTNEKLTTIAVIPVLTNRRMVTQSSNFIICGDSFKPIEEEYTECIKKFILPANTFKESQEFLELNGVSYFTLFPDLEGLSKQFKYESEEQILLIKRAKKRN